MRQGGHGLPDHGQFRRLDQLILCSPQIGLNGFSVGDFLFQLRFLPVDLAECLAQQHGHTADFIAPLNRDFRGQITVSYPCNCLIQHCKTPDQP